MEVYVEVKNPAHSGQPCNANIYVNTLRRDERRQCIVMRQHARCVSDARRVGGRGKQYTRHERMVSFRSDPCFDPA